MFIRFLSAAEWRLLRDLRLAALRDSPEAFLSRYELEASFDAGAWQREVTRGFWLVCFSQGRALAVLGATPEPDVGPRDRYLSYLWVAPHARRTGIATRLVGEMLYYLRSAGVRRAWLWVLDGNDAARSLYLRLGFVSVGDRQPISHDPSRSEERLSRELR